ncbi:MAG: transcriptional repressor [Paludibacter sp.]|nr:transcriptional repressor [Paludibacter sp.]
MNSTLHTHRYLLQYAIKPSVQRTAVMDYLLKNRTHPTIDEIYTALSPSMPTLSKTTVYNTLNLFLEKGAVQALVIDEKNARYDIDTSAHAHFICKKCGKVYDIFGLKPEVFELPQNPNFTIDSVEIAYSGTCNACKES